MLYFMFAEQKSLVHTGLRMDCQEHSFNTTLETVLQEGTYAINVSPKNRNQTNRARRPYWGILARGRGRTDRVQRGPYKNDRGPIFSSTARAS